MKKPGYLTLSIDDGHPLDFKAAELLEKYGLKATFYVPARNPEREVLSERQVRTLSQSFDVGCHTINHAPLKRLLEETAFQEVHQSKNWLEAITGKPAVAFCYPQGKISSRTWLHVKRAGFLGARTCHLNLTSFPKNPYLWGVSSQAYNHSAYIQLRHALAEKNFSGAFHFALTHRLQTDWVMHFLKAVQAVEKRGGVAHLYFHSWEIEEQKHWHKLEELFRRLAQETQLKRVSNSDLFALWWEREKKP